MNALIYDKFLYIGSLMLYVKHLYDIIMYVISIGLYVIH